MLNRYWADIVPLIDASGGVVEQFADGVMASFNTTGEMADHAHRAAATALAIVGAGRRLAAEHPGWPLFRAGVNTGTAVVGTVGSTERRSFAVIGDTTNTAARPRGRAGTGRRRAVDVECAGRGSRRNRRWDRRVKGATPPVEAGSSARRAERRPTTRRIRRAGRRPMRRRRAPVPSRSPAIRVPPAARASSPPSRRG